MGTANRVGLRNIPSINCIRFYKQQILGTGKSNKKSWIYTEFNVSNMGNYMGNKLIGEIRNIGRDWEENLDNEFNFKILNLI